MVTNAVATVAGGSYAIEQDGDRSQHERGN
jgi:hypothetical protein